MTLTFVSRFYQGQVALHSTLNISETIRDRGLIPKDPIGNGLWGIKWSRDLDVTWPRKVLWVSMVGAILSTAWLLVLLINAIASVCL